MVARRESRSATPSRMLLSQRRSSPISIDKNFRMTLINQNCTTGCHAGWRGMGLVARGFHSPPDVGGVAAPSKKMRSHRSGADGVVGNAEVLRRLRDFFLMSRPPLLCQEGSGAPDSFTPAYTHLPELLHVF